MRRSLSRSRHFIDPSDPGEDVYACFPCRWRRSMTTRSGAIREAITEGWIGPASLSARRGCGGSRHHIQGLEGAGRAVWSRAGHRYADFRGRVHGTRRGRRDGGTSSHRRHHVRRFPRARHGSARQPGGEDPLYVRRQVESAPCRARDDGRDQAIGRPALAIAARLACPHSRSQGRGAVDAGGRQGPLQERDP